MSTLWDAIRDYGAKCEEVGQDMAETGIFDVDKDIYEVDVSSQFIAVAVEAAYAEQAIEDVVKLRQEIVDLKKQLVHRNQQMQNLITAYSKTGGPNCQTNIQID